MHEVASPLDFILSLAQVGQEVLDTLLQFSSQYTAWDSVVPDSYLRSSHQSARGGGKLSVVPVPADEWTACNAVFANGTLLVRSKDECPQAFLRFEQYAATSGAAHSVTQLLPVHAGQVELVDGALTCSSILLTDSEPEGRS